MMGRSGGMRGAAITGAAGFLGMHLVRGFEARGARVLPLVRSLDAPRAGFVPRGAQTLDLAWSEPSVLEGFDVVVHAAGLRDRYGVDSATYRAANVELTERTMRAASVAGVRRFVLVSCVSVYGFPSRLPVNEDYPYAPRTLQAATKVESEMRAKRAAHELGLDLVIVRPSIIYGPGDRHGMIIKMAALMRARAYRIVGDGENVLHLAHIDDVVEGVWLAAERPEAERQDFILAGPETVTLTELSAIIAHTVGAPLFRTRVPVGLARAVATVVDVAAYRGIAFTGREPPVNHEKLDVLTLPVSFDVTKAGRRLGFSPRVGYDEGIMRTLRGGWPALARAGAAP
jgi:nucleoside-diphosphate-sugar epimerase